MWTREFVHHIATYFDTQRTRQLDKLNRGESVEAVLAAEDEPEVVLANWVRIAKRIEQERLSCAECRKIHDSDQILAPRHEPSSRCRSGGRPHCTCDTCF